MATLSKGAAVLDVVILNQSTLAEPTPHVLHFPINGGKPNVTLRNGTGLAGSIDYLCADADTAAAVHAMHKAGGVFQLDTTERVNLARDPQLVNATWPQQGSTGTVTHATTGGPNGLGYLQYAMATANTSSPMSVALAATGTGGIPCTPGVPFIVSSYWWQSVNSNVQRYDASWYNAAGALLSQTSGSDVILPGEPASTWYHESSVFTPPALAVFARPVLTWSGTYASGGAQTLRVADALVETGNQLRPFFSGAYAPPGYISSWSGAPNASTSRLDRVPAVLMSYVATSVTLPRRNGTKYLVTVSGVQEVAP